MDAIITLDASQHIVVFNSAAEKMFRCQAAEAIGSHIERFIPERFRAAHSRHIRHFGHTGETSRAMGKLGAISGLRCTGEEFPIEASISHVEAGGRMLSTVILRDITDRQRAQQALIESENRFRTMADSAPVLVWMSGTDKSYTWFNKAWLVFVGKSMDQEIGNGWSEGIHPDDLARSITTYAGAFDARQSFKTEHRLRRHDGEYRWLLNNGTPMHDPDGTFRGYIGSCIDITERRDAEIAIRESAARARLATSVSGLGVFEWNMETDWMTWENARMYEIFGRTVEEGPLHFAELVQDIVHLDDRRRVARELNDASHNNQMFRSVCRIRRKNNGEWRWIETSGMFDRGPDGTQDHMVGVVQDITERKQAEDSLHGAKEALEVRVSERTIELILANEQLRTQMGERRQLENALLEIAEQERRRLGEDLHDGLCQYLSGLVFMGRALAKTFAKQNLTEQAGEVEKLSDLIYQAVDQARSVAKGLHPVDVDAHGLAAALRDLASRTSREVSCRLRCARSVPISDNVVAQHLYRIAQEAVTNAVKHARPSRITITLGIRGNHLALSVRNDGSGLPVAFHHATGMGVRLMRYRADVIGGNFQIQPLKDGGTRVLCTLPMLHSTPPP